MSDLRACLHVEPNARSVAEFGARWIADVSRDAVKSRGACAIALTGGSSPLEMYSLLVEEPARSRVDWERTEWFFGDERAVPPDRPESNFGAAQSRIFQPRAVPAERVHRMPGERADLEAAAQEYEATVRRIVPAERDGVPVFDAILVGIGNDAHLLSLHPGCSQIGAPTGLVVALRSPPMNPPLSRITFTPSLLLAARRVLVIAHGSAKADALAAVIDGASDESRVPGQLLRRANGVVVILADPASTVKLAR